MSRIVQTGETPAKKRRAHLRSVAEAIRRLAERPAVGAGAFDEEAKDLTAFLVFNLRGIGAAIETSAQAWDDRNYWKKSEKLRADWRWAPQIADRLEAHALAGDWPQVTPVLMELLPHVADVNIAKAMRDADWWVGAYRALVKRAERRAALAR